VAEDRQPAERPAPADPATEASDDRTGGETESTRPLSVPVQPTRASAAAPTSRYEREHTSAAMAGPKRSRFAAVMSRSRRAMDSVRLRLASAIWMAAVLAAVMLCLGALLVALDANMDNSLVSAVLDLDRAIDGPFWKVFDFYTETKSGAQGAPDEVKNHLVNWGLAAAGYLIVGRLLDRLIRPASA
jgi:hypothetical protein